MHTKSDQELLLTLAQSVDENTSSLALDHFFKRHSNKIYNYALKRGLNGEQAQDVVQIVFLQLFRKRHQYNPQYAALAWLYVVTKSELKDYRLREVKGFVEFDDSLSQTEDPTPSSERAEEVSEILSELGERERRIVEERYLNEREYDEIAKLLGESESNLRQIVSRSMRFLKKKQTKKTSEGL